ncbi:MAG: type II secretion system F family protein [Gammaproteobacteria bacterium]|nr:type II secretion system F family protein [Gammaproteobacteria bacterium]MYB38218.1 type II secretion system F family protein [Gammaproteobacteria bacterium]
MIRQETSQTFLWEGTDRDGLSQSGEIEAASMSLARALLRRQAIDPQRIRRKAPGLFLRKSDRKVKPAQITALMRQLATVTHAGIPLVQAFDLVADAADGGGARSLVKRIREDVAGGFPLATALRRHPAHFDALLCNLVDAGEQSGALDEMLSRIATHGEKTRAIRGKVRRALTYPAAVVAIALAVTGLLLVKVVPQFESMFASFGAELPAATQTVIALSEFAQASWAGILAALIGAGVGVGWTRRRYARLRRAIDRTVLKVPVIGPIIEHSAVAGTVRTLATTLDAGVPLVTALTLVSASVGNSVFTTATLAMRDEVATGQSLAQAMRHAAAFPPLATQMVAVGEESGTLDDMLSRCATHYEELVDQAVDQLTALLEPVVMVVLGVLVGGLITAMYLPIFQIGGVVTG